MKTDFVSVIIPTRNRRDMLCRCIRSVLASDWKKIEVIVVDDCSTDGSDRAAAERFRDEPRVRFVRNRRNSLSAHSRNHGVQYADGEFILFLDDDNEVERDMITELVAGFKRHPDAGMIAPLTVHWVKDGRRIIWTLGSEWNPWTSRFRERYPGALSTDALPNGEGDYPIIASPNAFMVTRATFDLVGGLDEGYGMQFDDTDFGMRITVLAKLPGFITTKAQTRHFGYLDPNTTPQLRCLSIGFPKRAYTFARNRMKFSRRFSTFPQSLFVCLFLCPVFALYYCAIALKHRRLDIALAYLLGTIAGQLGLYRDIRFHPPYPES